MAKLPGNIYTLKEINALNHEDKKRYFMMFFLECLKANPDGLTVSSLLASLKEKGHTYSEVTLRKYLDYLVSVREAYSTQHGLSIVYHLNGKLIWDEARKSVTLGDKTYWFYSLTNPRGEFVFIQEREKDDSNIETVSGGIVVAKKHFKQFVNSLVNFANEGGSDATN